MNVLVPLDGFDVRGDGGPDGRRARGGVGSVADAVVRHAEMPVPLVGDTDRRDPVRAMPSETLSR